MPSQPDYTLAYSMNPEIKPEGAEEHLAKEKEKVAKLVALLAEKTGTTPEQVTALLDTGVTDALPDAVSTEPAVTTTTPAAPFFGSSEGTKFYPIDQFDKVSLKAENVRYFASEQEALDAGYKAA